MAEAPSGIGLYEVIGELGRGAFATTYRVRRGDAEYALKLCHVADQAFVGRLENEILLLQKLHHEGIPGYVNDGVHEGLPYLVMTLMPGTTLQRTIDERREGGAVHGDLEVMQLLVALLRILAYLHGENYVHRDIKAANVMTTPSGTVSLLDFGFCKEHGTTHATDDSFWRAGAAVYSPPAKLGDPGRAVKSHDVFAVGVLGYLMLTGELPWPRTAGGDVGDMRRQHRDRVPPPPAQANNRVAGDVSDFVMGLLELDDDVRTEAAEACERAEAVVASGSQRSAGSFDRHYPHVERDPLYGDIRLTEYEATVLATPQVQRLRWIKQLGLTNIVFAGAEHTRLSHALGSVYRVEQMLRAVEDIHGMSIPPETRLVARLFALVHDVPQVAFGHTVEDELGFFERHDRNQARIERLVVDSREDGLGQVLWGHEVGLGVLEHFDPSSEVHKGSSVTDLVSGPVGADVLDYIDRDALHCGLDHRVDSAIFRQFLIERDPGGDTDYLVSRFFGSEGIRLDREFAVEFLLLERYAMFMKVYTHKDKLAASAVLGKALGAALHPTSAQPPDFSEEEYEQMADAVVLQRLANSEKPLARRHARAVIAGVLPRTVYRAPLLMEGQRTEETYENRLNDLRTRGLFDPARRQEIEAELAQEAKLDPGDVIVYCPTKAPGAQKAKYRYSTGRERGKVVDTGVGAPQEIRKKHLGLWALNVFNANASPAGDAALQRAAEDRFEFANAAAVR